MDSSTGQASAEGAEGGGDRCNGVCSLFDEGVFPIVDRLQYYTHDVEQSAVQDRLRLEVSNSRKSPEPQRQLCLG